MTVARIALPLAALAALSLGACAAPPQHARASASARAIAACRQRADEVYDRQNRAAVYNTDLYAGGRRDAPFAGIGFVPNDPSAGLSQRYARETILDDCLNGAAGRPGTTPAGPTLDTGGTPPAPAAPTAPRR